MNNDRKILMMIMMISVRPLFIPFTTINWHLLSAEMCIDRTHSCTCRKGKAAISPFSSPQNAVLGVLEPVRRRLTGFHKYYSSYDESIIHSGKQVEEAYKK